MLASSRTSSCSSGTAASTGSKASSRSARRSQSSSPAAGTTLKASPERRIVGTAVSRWGPPGSLRAATSWQWQMLLYGILLVAVLFFMPQGIVPALRQLGSGVRRRASAS